MSPPKADGPQVPMRFEILNVEHGFCAYAEAADGRVLLFDCGHSATTRPSSYLPGRGTRLVQCLFVMNYDEDHISDLPEVRRRLNPQVLSRNTSVTSSQIRAMKTPPLSLAMRELVSMVDSYTGAVGPADLAPEGIQVEFFHNNYPTFTDTNNLSLLVFLDVGDVSFALAGDLERSGWLELLKNPQVQNRLRGVHVFVASHHGRESGYCREVFDFCRPSLIVMSDGPIQYDTQTMATIYSQHARGEFFNAGGRQEFRKVVTTRNDGNLFWTPSHVRSAMFSN